MNYELKTALACALTWITLQPAVAQTWTDNIASRVREHLEFDIDSVITADKAHIAIRQAGVFRVGDLWYCYNQDGTEVYVTCKNPFKADYEGDIVVPDSIIHNGKVLRVTGVGADTFMNCTQVTSVSLPDGIRFIGGSAFSCCHGLRELSLPENVVIIGFDAFSGCSGLRRIHLGHRVTSIGDMAFAGCRSLESVVIPEGVKSIGHKTFFGCVSLSDIILPKSLKNIGDKAFARCTSLPVEGDVI